MIDITQELVNETLAYIKEKYPLSNDNGLNNSVCARSDSPVNYQNDIDFLGQVILAGRWLDWASQFGFRKTINFSSSSYGIKHKMENHFSQKDGSSSFRPYVSNMAAIVSFIIYGLEISSHANPFTTISKKALKNWR